MKITVIGTGYVGLVAGACLADMGNEVICVDNNLDKLRQLEQGIIPIYEPGLDELVKSNVSEKRLIFSSDIDKAVKIIKNAKLQRLGVCNACESLVIHKDIADEALPRIVDMLSKNECEVRGDERAYDICPSYIKPAVDEDFGTEYLAKIISAKIVDSFDEAVEHINTYSTGHSEAIITEDYECSQRFLDEIDSACVYVNASTRFTDGFMFGFGAEIGISTQKLHARGPMGLKAITTTKYIIYGNGQVRQ